MLENTRITSGTESSIVLAQVTKESERKPPNRANPHMAPIKLVNVVEASETLICITSRRYVVIF